MSLGMALGDFVLDGDSVPFSQKGRNPLPKFSAHLYCGETAACIKMPLCHFIWSMHACSIPLGMEVGLGPGDFVLDGDPARPPKRGAEPPPPKFSDHVYCGQTAGWMKLVLGME